MWGLQLNPMMGRAEEVTLVAISETQQQLEQLIERERVEPYTDGRFHKTFRQGGPLEWFNYMTYFNEPMFVDIGSRETWMLNGVDQFDRLINTTYKV